MIGKGVNLVLRLVLGGVFVYAGSLKVFNPPLFAQEIDQYALVPHEMINLMAITLPWVEVTAGVLLILGICVRANALILAGLATVFFIAISSVLARGLKIKCGCFGEVGSAFIGPWHLLLDGALLAAAIWLVCKSRD
jgi:putative oxidoreductase